MDKPLSEMSWSELIDETVKLQQRNAALAAQVKGPDGFATWKDAAVDERVRRVAAEKREQALAAHVERMRDVWQRLHLKSPSPVEVLQAYSYVMRETPATSLARLKDERIQAVQQAVKRARMEWAREDKAELDRLKAEWQAEADRLDWLEQQARKSRTGISFDWVPTCEGEPAGFRFMRFHHVGMPEKTLRGAIDREIRRQAEGGE